MFVKFTVSAICLTFSLAYASTTNDFFNTEKEGYFYYKDNIKKEKKEKKIKKKKKTPSVIKTTKEMTTKEMMEVPFETKEEREKRLKKEAEYMNSIPWADLDKLSVDEYKRMLDTTRNIAVGTPKKEYVKTYMALQKFWVDKSERFSKVWRIVNIENPNSIMFEGNYDTAGVGLRDARKKARRDTVDFFDKKKDRLGIIVVIDDKRDEKVYKKIEWLYKKTKRLYKVNYEIWDSYEASEILRKLKIKTSQLPAHILLYQGAALRTPPLRPILHRPFFCL